MKIFKIYSGLTLILILSYSCEKYDFDGYLETNRDAIDELYLNSNDTISIGSQKLIMDPYLYRNFFHGGVGKKDHSLIASCDIKNANCAQIQENFKVEYLYVINDFVAGKSRPGNNGSINEYTLKYLSTEGPNWETGIKVDVIIELESNGVLYFLMAKDIEINKVQ